MAWMYLPQCLYVQDMRESVLGLDGQSQILEQSVTWRTKHSQSQTWLRRLKRVGWMMHLSGMTSRPLMANRLREWLTLFIQDFRASRSALRESEKEQMTLDIFGRILNESLRQLDLFGSSEKTSQDTLCLDSPKFTEAYGLWVTLLRQDCLRRQNAEHRTDESDCLSWPTIQAAETKRHDPDLPTRMAMECGLLDQDNPNTNGKNRELFPTPATVDAGSYYNKSKSAGATLRPTLGAMAKYNLWMTPEARNEGGYQTMNNKKYPRLGTQAKGRLNPDWVEQLMGLPVGWTDCDCLATEPCRNKRKRRSGV